MGFVGNIIAAVNQQPYVKLGIAALLPVIATAILYLAEEKTAFRKLSFPLRQLIIGIIFGGLAIVGTEWGIKLSTATVNCRDAAVLAAGLLFGGPAGIIAGIIGGVERWIAVAWGIGSFTRVACSVSTMIAGVFAAIVRKYMFESKKPGWILALGIGLIMESFHLTMVFVTNLATPIKALGVVKICTLPMVIANGLSVMLATIAVSLCSHEKFGFSRENIRISQTIQRWLFVTVLIAFLGSSYLVYTLQSRIANSQIDSQLTRAIDEVAADISDASDENLLKVTRYIAKEINADPEADLMELAERYQVAEINDVNQDGIIFRSTNSSFVGFDMGSGSQAAEFLGLLSTVTQYVQAYGPISYDETVLRKYAGVKTYTGFIQVGYNAEQFQRGVDQEIANITKNRHVGETGYILIFDANQELVSAPKGFSQSDIVLPEGMTYAENTTFAAELGGVSCFCRYYPEEGYFVVAVLPQEEALQMRDFAVYVNTFMEILAFAVLFGLVYILIKNLVVNQIQDINVSLARITGGDLNETVDVRTNEEFASLSDDINSTVDALKRYIDEASARIDQELEFAKNIQLSALPKVTSTFAKRKDFDIFAAMDPAKEVGGDFYDFYLTDADHLHFLIADVSGKGIPAAMFMMRAKTELRSLTEADVPLDGVFTTGNNALCEGNDAGMFVTAWQGGIDLNTGLVQFANVGHNPPLIYREKEGAFAYLRAKVGFVLAGIDGVRYKLQSFQLEPGDIVFLYTDGITEATNARNELYGEERLLKAINSRKFGTMENLCHFIKAEVDSFVGGAPQFDDMTMVALRYEGKRTE